MTTATLPRVRETRRPVEDFFRLRFRESALAPAINEVGRSARVVIITEGLGNVRDRNFYMPSAVASAVQAFEGKQFYLDHPSAFEDDDRPERSVRDLAGFFSDCETGSLRDPETGDELAACFATLHFAESEPGQLAFDQVRTALAYQKRYPNSKDVYAGISINAGGIGHPGTIKGMQVNIVTQLAEAFSADIVTKPARGGKFLAQVRESVVGSRAGISARVAEWQRNQGRASGQPHRAWIGLREGQGMATQTTLSEAQRKALTNVILRKLKEAWPPSGGAAPKDDAASAARGEDAPAEVPAGDSSPEATDVVALAQDIQQDIATLIDNLPGSEQPLPGVDGPLGVGGDEEGEIGMGMDQGMRTGGDEMAGAGAGRMKYACEGCGRENEVLPPSGYTLTRSTEVERRPAREAHDHGNTAGHDALVDRLRRQLETKEVRFQEAKGNERRLLRENIALRAENHATRLEQQAAVALREAKIPADVLSVDDLVGYHPSQWKWQITIADRFLAREARRGGMSHRSSGAQGGGSREAEPPSDGDAAKHFADNYPRGER